MPVVRVTGVVVEDGRLLLIHQPSAGLRRSWSLPGGKVEEGETLADALIREMREETGIEVEAGRLLYVCDHVPAGRPHVVHITLEARRVGGHMGDIRQDADTHPILAVRFVPLGELTGLGFTERFAELAKAGFPDAGSYAGLKANIGL